MSSKLEADIARTTPRVNQIILPSTTKINKLNLNERTNETLLLRACNLTISRGLTLANGQVTVLCVQFKVPENYDLLPQTFTT